MSACVREFSRADVETELSSVGNSLLQAWHFGDLTPLSHKQAHVYALREKAGFSRDETAAILNISPKYCRYAPATSNGEAGRGGEPSPVRSR